MTLRDYIQIALSVAKKGIPLQEVIDRWLQMKER